MRPPGGGELDHEALLRQRASGWADTVSDFVREGIGLGEPVSVAVSGPAHAALGGQLGQEPLVDLFDMARLGRNPGRIIAAMLDFAAAHDGRPLRYVSEPIWAGRSAAERAEVARHEALVALALADVPARILCLYDTSDPAALACAEQTHPVIRSGGRSLISPAYAGRGVLPAQCDIPLPRPPRHAMGLPYDNDLSRVRAHVLDCAAEAGLADGRITDLVLAVSEVAANTLRHTAGGGLLLIWHTPAEIICQITDSGHIDDPLAGRRRPARDASGQGLWVVNQVCDLVELRSGHDGTTVRMHIRL
jgi:anti-sigma regulatory factor (Ser/Thr protein kinase)